MATANYDYQSIFSDTDAQMRLDTLSRWKLALIYFSALTAFAVCATGACFAPEMYEVHKGEIFQCKYLPEGNRTDCIKTEVGGRSYIPMWVGTLRDVGPMSQFLIISADVYSGSGLQNISAVSIEFDMKLGISLRAELNEDASLEILKSKQVTHRISCGEEYTYCGSMFLGYEPFVEFSTYEVMISLNNWPKIESLVSRVDIRVRSVSERFSTFQLYVKCAFFAVSMVSLVFYLIQLRRSTVQKWSVETQSLVLLSLASLLFNDPFFGLSLNHPHVSLTALSVFCVIQFIGVLGYFWARVLMEIRPIPGKHVLEKALPVYLGVLCAALISLYVYSAVLMKSDPSYQFQDFPIGVVGIAVVSLGMTAVYIAWLCYLTFRAMPSIAQQTKRQRFLYLLNLGMAGFTTSCIAAGLLQRTPSIGPAVLIVVAAFNIYTILMQALLVPVKEAGRAGGLEMVGMQGGSTEGVETPGRV